MGQRRIATAFDRRQMALVREDLAHHVRNFAAVILARDDETLLDYLSGLHLLPLRAGHQCLPEGGPTRERARQGSPPGPPWGKAGPRRSLCRISDRQGEVDMEPLSRAPPGEPARARQAMAPAEDRGRPGALREGRDPAHHLRALSPAIRGFPSRSPPSSPRSAGPRPTSSPSRRRSRPPALRRPGDPQHPRRTGEGSRDPRRRPALRPLARSLAAAGG